MFSGNIYFKEPLSREQQKKYFLRANQGDENAKEIILEHNLKLINYVINHYYYNFDEDLKKEFFSVGCVELWKCIQNFNVNLKTEFSTYAIPSIYGGIKRYLRNNKQIHIPRKISTLATDILNLENENNKQFSDSELANLFKASIEDINLAKTCNLPLLSINQPLNNLNTNKTYIQDVISDQDFLIYENLEKKEIYKELMKTINKLPEKQKKAIILLFGFDGHERKQEEVAKILNVTQSTISRIKNEALKKLKQLLPDYIKEEYNQKTYYISKK